MILLSARTCFCATVRKQTFICSWCRATNPLRQRIFPLRSARLVYPLQNRNIWKNYLDITPGSVSVLGLMNDHEEKVQLLIDEDVLKDPYFGCHPCINTSSLKFTTKDFTEKIIPALEHEPIIVNLENYRWKNELNFAKLLLETLILTGAVAIIAAAVYFFPRTEPCFCQQYFRSWNRSF